MTIERLGVTSCSELSRAAGEPLFATASTCRVWLLLEHPGPWGRDALRDSVLPVRVRHHLERAIAAIPGARPLLIRRGRRRDPARPFTFVLAVADEARPFLRRWQLATYDDLLDLDLPLEAARAAPAEAAGPLLAVCVHGAHDQCCARYGRPAYRRLVDAAASLQAGDTDVWQSSHLGGDRFAPNVTWLPWGVSYGRLAAADLAGLAGLCRDGRLSLPHYRGRSCYRFVVQAAEHFVRAETGLDRVDGLRLAGCRRLAESRFRAAFYVPAGPTLYVADVERRASDLTLRVTCRAELARPVPQFRLLGLEASTLTRPLEPGEEHDLGPLV